MLSAPLRLCAHPWHRKTLSKQLHGSREKALLVKASSSMKGGGDEEIGSVRRAKGALAQTEQRRRWRLGSWSAGGGLWMQF